MFFSPSASNANACRATGRGLQPTGVRVKEVADFTVFTKGAGTGELKVSVKGPGESFLNLLFFKGVILSLFAHHLIRLCLENADD